MPNPNTIPYYRYQDLQIPDAELQQQFLSLVKIGEFNRALLILANNAQQLQGKAFIANTINIIISGLLEMENRYYENVPLFLSNLSKQYSKLILNFKNAGLWNIGTQYTPYNFVDYNGDMYMCLQEPPIGTYPTDTNYWLFIGIRGPKGSPGIDVSVKFDWDSQATYAPNDVVVLGSNMYVALAENTGVNPETSPDTWSIFLSAVPGKIFVGVTPPTILVQDVIWFQTESDPFTATTTDPINGQFYRWDEFYSQWEPMYPETLFRWVTGTEGLEYIPAAIEKNITISNWEEYDAKTLSYTYTYSGLAQKNIVEVFPAEGISKTAFEAYNKLDLIIEGDDIIFTISSSSPYITEQIPVVIKIQ